MKCIPTAIPEAFIIEPKVFGDERGFFFENLNHRRFTEIIGREIDFVQDNHIRSAKNVLRVVQSTVFDVAVDIRESPPTFGQPVGVELSADNKRMLWVPEFER
ncbi:MAG: dTDP-4-dehydrorhamnose 3,5-epimerase family protein, partial [Rugosibacter sp.]|nr:dTDP-4-dehydrorhamnose 3,5-epimerase family protein [Rugosibacter sp.]